MFNQLKKIALGLIEYVNHIPPESVSLVGTVVVATGASRGIGKAICNILAQQGAYVFAVSRNLDELKSTFNRSKFYNKTLFLIRGDITSEGQITSVFTDIFRKFQRVDVLINNAAVNSHKEFTNTTVQEFNHLMETNIKGMYLTCKAVIPLMKVSKAGLIINIGSKISHNTNIGPNKVLYATSKYAVEGFTNALSSELSKFGIRVTCLMPGTVNTFISRKMTNFLSPMDVANIVLMIIKFKQINFESILFKSNYQNI